jgi:flagellar export protein FliJ
MKVRSCWAVLENRVEKRLAQLQADTGQALRVRESLLGSRQRLAQMLQEYQAQTVGPSSSTGMSAALNHRQFMTRLVLLRERVEQDLATASSHLASLEERTRRAQEDLLKMQSLKESDLKAVQKYHQQREQAGMDALGVMQFNQSKAA